MSLSAAAPPGEADPATVSVTGLTWAIDGRTVLDGVDLTVAAGRICGVLGPNGSGKSSLLRCLFGAITPDHGRIALDGVPLASLGRRALARQVAVVFQHGEVDPGTTVAQVVALGRLPHQGVFAAERPLDREVVARVCAQTDITHLRHRPVETLSGGERQRVQLARALAQQPRVLMLDEPTNHLDLLHQEHLVELVRGLGVTTLIVLHDLSLAARVCDQVIVLHEGRARVCGPPRAALTVALLRDVWEVEAELLVRSDGHLAIAPTGPAQSAGGSRAERA